MLQRFQKWINERMTHRILGLDIGLNAVKLLEIDHTNSPSLIQNLIVLPLSDRIMTKEGIKNPETLGSLLKEALKRENISTKNVAIAISRSSVVIKEIQISQKLKPSEIESRVWVEANRHFPELVGDIYLDFTLLGPVANDATQQNVMLVACRKDQVKLPLEAIRYAGLEPKIIDVTSFALERALIHMTSATTQPETIALINLDLVASHFIVMHKSALYYALDQVYDGQKLMTQVNEYLKAQPANENAAVMDEAYLTILRDNLISHIRHAMHFFFSSRPNTMIQRLFVSGDCSMIPFLSTFLQQEFGIETVLANPFDGMIFADHIDKTLAPSTFMLSSGLALSKYS